MKIHQGFLQGSEGARVAFGFSGITDEDEARETPGLAAKDVTPKAARNVPLDPFAQPPGEAPTIEAETHEVVEPTQEDMLASALLEAVADSDAENLDELLRPFGSYVEQANAALTGAKLEMVKKAIHARRTQHNDTSKKRLLPHPKI